MEVESAKQLRPEVRAWEQKRMRKGMLKEEVHYDSGFSDGSYLSSRFDSSASRLDSTRRAHDDGYDSLITEEPERAEESSKTVPQMSTQLSDITETIDGRQDLDESEQISLVEDMRTLQIAPAPCPSSVRRALAEERDEVYRDNTHYQNYACCGDPLYLLAPFRHLLSMPNDDGDTALHLAVINGRLEIAHQFLTLRPNDAEFLDQTNDLGQTALHLAIMTAQSAMVEYLLAAGADPRKVDRDGNTPLHLAAMGGRRQIVPMILCVCDRRGVRRMEVLEQRNFEGLTAFHLASRYNQAEMMALLVYHGASVDAQDYSSGRSALHHAVENKQLSVAGTLLFKLGADVNAVTFDGCTALHLAAGREQCDMVAVLVAAGADASIRSAENDLPVDLTRNDKIRNTLQGF